MIVAAMLSLAGGCTETGMLVGGAAAGAAASQTAAGIEADLEAQQEALLARQVETIKKLEASNDLAETAALEAEIAALKKKLEINASAQVGVQLGRKAMGTDWKDPTEYAPWVVSVIATGLGYLQRKEKVKLSTVLTAVNEGVEKYKAQTDPVTANKLYETIKERKTKNGVS